MMTNKKIYYAHPINLYDTPLEKDIERMIQLSFYQLVENPNQKHHAEGYQLYKEMYGNGMKYYLDEVLPKCLSVVSVPFPEGTFGAGVAMEHNFITKNGGSGYVYDVNKGLYSLERVPEIITLSVDETKERVYKYDFFGNLK